MESPNMRRLLAVVTALLSVFAAAGAASASEESPDVASGEPAPLLGTPGRGYALGGARVAGIPYEEYIRRTGAQWFPHLDRQIVDYPAGQVQGHTLERLFPGIGRIDDDYPGLGLDGPSVGESVDEGAGNVIRAVEEGGQGMVLGLSEGALVVNAVQALPVGEATRNEIVVRTQTDAEGFVRRAPVQQPEPAE